MNLTKLQLCILRRLVRNDLHKKQDNREQALASFDEDKVLTLKEYEEIYDADIDRRGELLFLLENELYDRDMDESPA